MFFAITTLIGSNAHDIYAAVEPARDAYLDNNRSRILVAGSFIGRDSRPIGSLYIVEADSLLAATQFVEADPMTSSGAVASIDIVEWAMRRGAASILS